ncbi:MAG: tRNA 2-thiouridine(34) synthase MnmA [Coprococcus sp.]|nr:tRNA 2-thiouridine(34) synthase MnmA [Coprococcus sp.]
MLQINNNKTVCVGMSGGVDSSVAALLLKEQGYNVIGVTMQIWQDEDRDVASAHGGCCGLSAVDDARRVAAQLDIPYYVMNFKEEFKRYVIDYFVDEYRQGRTPNPCIACNRYVKWESLLARCMAIGGDYIATGHYAQILKLPNGRYTLREAKGIEKDQTYALYNLTQEQLTRTLMPVGEYSKPEIRRIAEANGLMVAHKPDSQDICFVPDGDYAGYLESEAGINAVPGDFVDIQGNVIGKHKGIIHYTIGQRKGLGLAMGHPVFVVDIVPETNQVVIGDNGDVFSDRLICNKVHFMSIEDLTGEMHVKAKIRYNHKGSMCTIRKTKDGLVEAIFDEPVRAVTKGQAVVFYEDNHILGGGVIC